MPPFYSFFTPPMKGLYQDKIEKSAHTRKGWKIMNFDHPPPNGGVKI